MSKASSKPAKGIVWQLNGLYKGPNDPNLEQDKVLLRKKVESFSKNWRTKINDETNPEDFLTAIKEYEDIIDLLVLISSYASCFTPRTQSTQNDPDFTCRSRNLAPGFKFSYFGSTWLSKPWQLILTGSWLNHRCFPIIFIIWSI